MKLKCSIEKIKTSHLLTVFIFALVSCTGLRFYHSMNNINCETGFYTNVDFTVILFYAILVFAVLFILIAGFLSADNRKLDDKVIHPNKGLGVVSIFLSLAMLIDTGYSFIMAISEYANGTNVVDDSEYVGLIRNGRLPYSLLSIFSFLACIYFLAFATGVFKKKSKFASNSILALLPLGWACTKMIPLFIKQISFVRVSDLLLEVAVVSLLIAYTISLAQCLSGVYEKEAQWRITALGFAVALVSLVLNIPKLVFVIIGKGETYITSGYPTSYSEIMFAVFALVLIFSTRKRGEIVPPASIEEETSDVPETSNKTNQ